MLRYDADDCRCLLDPDLDLNALRLVERVGFEDPVTAILRLRRLCRTEDDRALLVHCLPALLVALIDAATPDVSLVNFERLVQLVPERTQLFAELAERPRAVEILFRLFVGSQFLTEILLRNPAYLDRLTQHKRLAEFKSRPQFLEDAATFIDGLKTLPERLNGLRKFQQWELLRLAACDTFNLLDLKTVTLQLSLLADSLVQQALNHVAAELRIDASEFAVLAFGKLGGEELNYSSDIDLVFVVRSNAERYWGIGQKLIKALNESTDEGFLYRVDMRLRPWGKSGPLVTTIDGYVDYLAKHGRLWEKQSLLKARTIAGDETIGRELLERIESIVFDIEPDAARQNVLEMKLKIERGLPAERDWAHVKGGQGGIRDVEFLTQYLQLAHGHERPIVRSINTLDGLVRLTDADLLLPGEYRHLSSGYVFQRTVEHALQLMHNRQQSELPDSYRELDYLARRLDFPSAEHFVSQYREHRRFVRDIFERHILRPDSSTVVPLTEPLPLARHLGTVTDSDYAERFTSEKTQQHLQWLDQLDENRIVCIDAQPIDDARWELTVVGYDQPGDLSLICGLLFAFGFNIESGDAFTGSDVRDPAHPERSRSEKDPPRRRKFVNVFEVQFPEGIVPPAVWARYESELAELLRLTKEGKVGEAQGQLARRVAAAVPLSTSADSRLLTLDIEIDNDISKTATVMQIRAKDTPGFLYELSNALTVSGLSIQRVQIRTDAERLTDTLFVTTADGRKITDPQQLQELRAAVVLTKQFTRQLGNSPNPETALLHFRKLLENLFQQDRWVDQFRSLEQPEVLATLARLLGGSDFLWEDFLRHQHSNLFPMVTDVAALREPRTFKQLRQELHDALQSAANLQERRQRLNAFKDREMFRADLRHILDMQSSFGEFSQELTWIVEVVIEAACQMGLEELRATYGVPRVGGVPTAPSDNKAGGRNDTRAECAFSVCALGKCGGQELGFASDIELMFLYEAEGFTDGPESISNTDFFVRFVESFRKSISARRQGVFEIDLRLRPYGKAGSLAVSQEIFGRYFRPDGPAWPFERQALVKLRAIAGNREFGKRIERLRDRILYAGEPFDVAAMRGMRERQVTELVQAGTFNAKLSPGGLVDVEYFVQALQITFGHARPELREPNTRQALKQLEQTGILADRIPLRDAYRFLRRLIDALRMVRGDARDLTVPPPGTDEFEFLARRLGYDRRTRQLQEDFDRYTEIVRDHQEQLETLIASPT